METKRYQELKKERDYLVKNKIDNWEEELDRITSEMWAEKGKEWDFEIDENS